MAPRIVELNLSTTSGQTTATLRVRSDDGVVIAEQSASWPSTTGLSTLATWVAPILKSYLSGLTVADLASVATADTDLLGLAALLLLSR